jgi:hypothetical protein
MKIEIHEFTWLHSIIYFHSIFLCFLHNILILFIAIPIVFCWNWFFGFELDDHDERK